MAKNLVTREQGPKDPLNHVATKKVAQVTKG